jgi:peptide methionine sulfoxide reductase msrA/msrB
MDNKDLSLTPDVLSILRNKATEAPFSGVYPKDATRGTYVCRGCGLALFRASSQFTSGCGWPSFDDEIPHAILRKSDADGRRTEILCVRCQGHLGHVFTGEQLTSKNMRHCVNALAVDFVEDEKILDTQEAILAAGCFWGVEYYLNKLPGVLKTEVGYIGGKTKYPSYRDVCEKNTGHLEALRVLFDPSVLSYENLLKYFFEIHDHTQKDGQGPDIGEQYLSAVFYFDDTQKETVTKLIRFLETQSLKIATAIHPMSVFWSAEAYHQAYYDKNHKTPYCHQHIKRQW